MLSMIAPEALSVIEQAANSDSDLNWAKDEVAPLQSLATGQLTASLKEVESEILLKSFQKLLADKKNDTSEVMKFLTRLHDTIKMHSNELTNVLLPLQRMHNAKFAPVATGEVQKGLKKSKRR